MTTVNPLLHRDPGPIYDIAKQTLADQITFGNEVETKLGLFMSVGGAVLAALPAVMALRGSNIDPVELAALAVSSIAYAVLLAFSIPALWVRTWGLGPSAKEMAWDAIAGKTDREIQWRAVRTYQEHEDENAPKYAAKSHALRVCLVCFTVETIVVYIGLLATMARL